MATKNNPGEFDCYAAAEPDEPLFVLLGRDRHAPTLVWLWAVLRELHGEDAAKVEEARATALAMIAWGSARGRKYEGLAASTLAGAFELVRVANWSARDAKNSPTNADVLRRWLAITNLEEEPPA